MTRSGKSIVPLPWHRPPSFIASRSLVSVGFWLSERLAAVPSFRVLMQPAEIPQRRTWSTQHSVKLDPLSVAMPIVMPPSPTDRCELDGLEQQTGRTGLSMTWPGTYNQVFSGWFWAGQYQPISQPGSRIKWLELRFKLSDAKS